MSSIWMLNNCGMCVPNPTDLQPNCSYRFVFFVFFFLSPLVWFFLWHPEEVLALLFLLHRENGDFSIVMKDICLVVVSKPQASAVVLPQSRCRWRSFFLQPHQQGPPGALPAKSTSALQGFGDSSSWVDPAAPHGLLCPQHWHLQLVWENPPQSLNSAISVNASGYGTWVESARVFPGQGQDT